MQQHTLAPLALRLLAPLSLCATTVTAQETSAWISLGVMSGVTVEERPVPRSDFPEIRVGGLTSDNLDRLCEVIFRKKVEGKALAKFRERVVLKDSGAEQYVYERVKVPLMSDRDYVVHSRLVQPASSGRCEVQFWAETDPTRPPVKDAVRMKGLRGHWLVRPATDGKLSVTYEIFSDPGGNIPAFLARGTQRDMVVSSFNDILREAGAAGSAPPLH